MPQSSAFTPLLIYSSNVASNVPSASNLTNSTLGAELAINITDGKLYFKNNSGVVTLLASASGALSLPVLVSQGGTGATTVSGAQTNLQVDPAGTAVAMAIALG